ncbi:7 transmembrane receptor (rhodopsin family) domain-containing protein [Ditylenchus destructor]|nr:7 transmembrane receptor (rhodopsin family) domain-containing protein [Ditylenchus destructor]
MMGTSHWLITAAGSPQLAPSPADRQKFPSQTAYMQQALLPLGTLTRAYDRVDFVPVEDHSDGVGMKERIDNAGDFQGFEMNGIQERLDATELMLDELMSQYGHNGSAEDFTYENLDYASQNGGGSTSLSTASLFLQSKSSTNDMKMAAVLLCDILGALCILLNLFVIASLVRNRRRVLTNVFYILVLHCAIVDLIRGGCLVAWGMPHLLPMRTMQDRLMALKINQFTLVILRSCNLLTIFNLLVFTTNEFIVIKYPLHYRRYFRRRTVLVILAMSWMVSLLFGVGSVFSNFFESAHSVMVLNNGTIAVLFRNDTAAGGEVTRREIAGLPVNVISMLMIFILCYVCLFTVLICYGTILRTIRRFHLVEKGKSKFHSDESQRISQRSSIYQQRFHHNTPSHGPAWQYQSTHSNPHTPRLHHHGHSPLGPAPSVATTYHYGHNHYHPHAHSQSMRETASAVRETNGINAADSHVIVADSGTNTPGQASVCTNCTTAETQEAIDKNSRRCNSHRKWRSHLMSRHKYLIVIGTVLFVDVLFLFPYSGIQMVAFLHLNNVLATSHKSTLIRWGLQILIGIHSVCQPLCYFRMNEFRRLACCSKKSGGINRSKSFSQTKDQINTADEETMLRFEQIIAENGTADLKFRGPTTPDTRREKEVLINKSRQKLHKKGSGNSSTNSVIVNALRKISSSSIILHDHIFTTESEDDDGISENCQGDHGYDDDLLSCCSEEAQEECAEMGKHGKQKSKKRKNGTSSSATVLACKGFRIRKSSKQQRARDMQENTMLNTPFLESNWSRVGTVGKFRTYGTAKNEEGEVKQKLSNLSNMTGLRSNSVFDRESLFQGENEEARSKKSDASRKSDLSQSPRN